MGAREIKARMATDKDAPAISALAEMDGFRFEGIEIDWSEIWPYWIVAEHEEEVIGAVQTCPSKPIGRIELLFLDPWLSRSERAIAVRLLIDVAESLLRQQGSQLSAGTIADENPEFLTIAENRGWVNVGRGDVVMRRLR